MTIMMIPLSCLRLSKQNVRKTGADQDIESLAASILANGVLQNLLGVATKSKKVFDVIAGSRRMLALRLLESRGEIDGNYQVPFRSIDENGSNIAETSLAENFHRLAMTPADECRAFQHFLGKDGDVDAVAKRFGLTRRFIEGRLRLAHLASVIFDALSEGIITLDVAKAYAITADQERQTQVYEQLQGGWSANDVVAIRRHLLQNNVSSQHPAALLIGELAYTQAGGRVEKDLFSEEAEINWLDPQLVEGLATAKLTEFADTLKVKLQRSWITPILGTTVPYERHADYKQLYGTPLPLTDDEDARLNILDQHIEPLCTMLDAHFAGDESLDDATLAALEAQIGPFIDERDAIRMDRPMHFDEQFLAGAGQFLILNKDGTAKLDSRLWVSKAAVLAHEAAPTVDAERGAPRADAEPPEKNLSQKLIAELSMQRRDILALHIANHPALAFDYASFALADRMLHHAGSTGNALVLGSREDPMSGMNAISTPAGDELGKIETALDRSWCASSDVVERFSAFQALDADRRAAWLAFCVGNGVKATLASDTGYRCAKLHNHLGGLLDIDVAAWWRPTAENYFGRINKARMVNILDEFGGPTLAARYSAAKRGELAIACEKLCAGNAIVEPDIRERATHWVPPVMLFTPSVIPEEEGWGEELDADSAALNDNAEHTMDEPSAEERTEPALAVAAG